MKTPSPTDLSDTRSRLLDAAGEIFAAQGFRQSTVRDIVLRAKVNIAAVNYHFGDKLGLYKEVLRHWLGAALEKYPVDGGLAADAPARDRLHAFVESFLHRLMDQGVPAWHGKLMAREMADPTPGVLEMLVQTHIRKQAGTLFSIVRELLGPKVSDDGVRLCAFSVVGQIMFHRHCQPSIRLIAPANSEPYTVEQLADHITAFSLAGIEGRRAEGAANGKSARPAARAKERP